MGFGRYRCVAAVILFPVMALIAAAPAFAERRVALIIGNGAYKNATALPNPRNDAQDVAAALKRIGFETIVGLDLDRAGMDDHAVRFARAAREADVAIFYYSGHAMQFAGVNYLMPVDARLSDEADLRRMAKVDDIVADLQQAKNLRILVLDSCRDNPLAEDLKRSIGRTRAAGIARGLAKIDSPQGMIVAYATQSGRTADDGSGRNSPYTTAFLKHVEAQEEIGTVFRRVSADVFEATRRAQLPELSLSLIGEFYLKGRPQLPVAAGQAGAPASSSATEAAMVWSATRDTTNIAVLEAFVARYADSFHANLARARIEELKKTQVAAVAPPVQPATPPSAVQPAVGVFPTSRAAKPLTLDEERALKPKNNFKECDTCPELVVVPAGSFTMGSPESENSRHKHEGPQHRVTFAKAFAAGRFAVTFAEWDACVAGGGCNGYKPSDHGWGRGKRPVIDVNWNDAKAYVAWLSRKTGKTYRLLSEAEREYVTRAGTTTPFWMGATISTSQANYNGNYTYDNGQKGEYRQRTVPVDSFAPNPWGLYQVHGNVKEWTEDCWNEGYRNAPADGSAWTSGDCGRRVVRSGNWSDPAWPLRAASRLGDSVSTRINSFGFRVARTLAP